MGSLKDFFENINFEKNQQTTKIMQNYPSYKEFIFTQETEEKLRQTVALVTEREDQIHQLQGELQDTEKVLTLNLNAPIAAKFVCFSRLQKC